MPKPHLYIHTPEPIFKARVNMATITYPLSALTYDGVTLGAFGDIQTDMTLLLGSAEGLDDLGRTRVKNLADATTIPIPRTSKGVEDGTLFVQDNMYITVLNDYRVWAKLPYFDLDAGIDYKDGDIAVGTYNTNIPPVSNCGPGFAGYVDAGTGVGTVTFDGSFSFAVTDGATISTYAWDIGTGVVVGGAIDEDTVTVEFDPGFYWVALTVTDSNARPHTSRCPVLIIDPDADPTFTDYQCTQRLTKEGQTLEITLQAPLSRTDYPDGTLVMFWWDEAASASDRNHMKFIGWMDTDNQGIGRAKTGIRRSASFTCLDVMGRLGKLPGFPQALYREQELDDDNNVISPWSYMPSLDMHKALYYLLFWHSTALTIADFILPSLLNTYDSMRLDSGADSLAGQVRSLSSKIVPDYLTTCNPQGQILVQRNWMLDDVGDRPTIAPILTTSDYNDLRVDYDRHPKYYVLRSGAIEVSTDWIVVDGEDTLPLVFCNAPGNAAAFGQGTQEGTENEGLALSQDDLNVCEGHRYALLNSRFGNIEFSDPTGENFWDYVPALMARIQVNVDTSLGIFRPFDETQLVGMVDTVNVNYRRDQRGLRIGVSVSMQKEEEGFPAETYVPEDTEDVGYQPGTPPLTTEPPSDGLVPAQDLLAGISQYHLYRTFNFTDSSPNWEKISLAGSTSDKILSWVVDPFSPGYLTGTGEINGWYVTHDKIYRIEDIFGASPTKTAVHTFATDAAGATHWRTIQASFGAYFAAGSNPWLMVISYYGDTVGHTGTYCTYSVDGGTTFSSETTVSTEYDSGITYAQPIGIYCSPKTPGLAYTVAYYETATPATTVGYVTTDWGATWAAMVDAVDPDTPNPAWGTSTGSGNYTYIDSSLTSGNVFRNGPNGSSAMVFMVHPPATTVRVDLSGHYEIAVHRAGFTNPNAQFQLWNGGAGIDDVTFESFSNGGAATSVSTSSSVLDNSAGADFTVSMILNAGGWPNDLDEVASSPPTGPEFPYLRILVTTSNDGGWAEASLSVRVTEIELADGTIYQPTTGGTFVTTHSQAGAIHLPWPDNADESVIYYGAVDRTGNRAITLKRNVAGVNSSIGPTDFGVDSGHFTIRSHDTDRQYMLLAGRGNGSSAARSSDNAGVWKSANAGDTWTNLVASMAVSGTLYGLFAAFGATDTNEMFIWGGYTAGSVCMLHSTDGSTLDNKEGDLSTLVEGTYGDIAFLGIAGGPTSV